MIQKDPAVRARLVCGKWKDFFGELDTDGDGTIDEDELVAYYVSKVLLADTVLADIVLAGTVLAGIGWLA